MTASSAVRTAECWMGRASQPTEDCVKSPATSHALSSAPSAATAAPTTASTVPRCSRRIVTFAHLPSVLPPIAPRTATPEHDADGDDRARDADVQAAGDRHRDDRPDREPGDEADEREQLGQRAERAAAQRSERDPHDDHDVDPAHGSEGRPGQRRAAPTIGSRERRSSSCVVLAGTLLAGCGTSSTPPPPDGIGYARDRGVRHPVRARVRAARLVRRRRHQPDRVVGHRVDRGVRGRAGRVGSGRDADRCPGRRSSAAGCWSSGCLARRRRARPARSSSSSTPRTRPPRRRRRTHPGSGIAAITCTGPGRCLALVTSTTTTAVFQTTDSGACVGAALDAAGRARRRRPRRPARTPRTASRSGPGRAGRRRRAPWTAASRWQLGGTAEGAHHLHVDDVRLGALVPRHRAPHERVGRPAPEHRRRPRVDGHRVVRSPASPR